MTIEEFDKIGWNANSKVEYKNAICPVHSVDFEEKLIAIPLYLVCGGVEDENELQWIRCENAELLTIKQS